MKRSRQEVRKMKAEQEAKRAARHTLDAGLSAHRARGLVTVNVERLKPGPYGGFRGVEWPEFVERGYYLDQPFQCQDCGTQEVWTARQQKWWYEIAQGGVWTVASRCRPCRRRERDRKAAARKTHLEGLAKTGRKPHPSK